MIGVFQGMLILLAVVGIITEIVCFDSSRSIIVIGLMLTVIIQAMTILKFGQ